MPTSITTVASKGAPLSAAEFDANLVNLKATADAAKSSVDALTGPAIIDIVKGNDGPGSEIDADLLDGAHGSYYDHRTNGLGDLLSNHVVTDADTATETGFYEMSGTLSNQPAGETQGYLQTFKKSTTSILQVFFSPASQKAFIRSYATDTWGAWVSVAGSGAGVTNGDSHDHVGGDGAQIDHGGLAGIADDDHTQYVRHNLATADSDMLVGQAAGSWIKKTLAEIKTILGLGSAAYTASGDYAVAAKGVTGGDGHDHTGGAGATVDHGVLSGLADDDHTQYTKHSLATAANDFLVASGSGAFVKKTQVETLAILTTGVTAGISIVIDGSGSVITTGIKGDIEIPYACTLTAGRMFADASGSVTVSLWRDTYANFPPVVGDLLDTYAISSATKMEETGISISLAAGDIIRFNVDSCTTITRVTLALRLTRT